MTIMWWRNALARMAVAARWFGGAAGLAVGGYAAAGLLGGAIPANRDWRPPARGVTVYVESNGVHVGIVVPKRAAGVDWGPLLRAEQLRDPRYAGFDHASFGWGEAKFYLETPTWRDVKPATIAAAAVGSDRVLVHVDHVPAPVAGGDVRAVVLRPAEYRRLAAYLRASMAARPGHRFGYGANDAFYDGRGRYSAVRTCNAWAGDALRFAGVRVGAWTPFPATVLWWF